MEAAAIAEQPLWRALLWDNSPLKNSRRFWIVVTMQTLQQMGGINAVACEYIFSVLHFPPVDANLE